MPQVIEPIAASSKSSTDAEPQVVLNFSLSLHSLVEAIAKLGLKELIQLKRLIERQINHALESYAGNDELILDEIKNHRLISQEIKPVTENPEKEEIIEDFRQA